jgi:hypothetical protein
LLLFFYTILFFSGFAYLAHEDITCKNRLEAWHVQLFFGFSILGSMLLFPDNGLPFAYWFIVGAIIHIFAKFGDADMFILGAMGAFFGVMAWIPIIMASVFMGGYVLVMRISKKTGEYPGIPFLFAGSVFGAILIRVLT